MTCRMAALALLLLCGTAAVQGFLAPAAAGSASHHAIAATRQQRSSSVCMMAEGGKKKRRKRREGGGSTGYSSEGEQDAPATKVASVNMSQDTSFNPDLANLFEDDWSGMQQPRGMKKVEAAAPLPAAVFSKAIKSTAAAAAKEVLPDLKNFESKLSPITGTAPRERSAAERFEEGTLVKSIKAATWAAVIVLVAWEVGCNC
jgi:hypothetical protein